jgi:uncharacterized protein involved in response to NO
VRGRLLLLAVGLDSAGVLIALAGWMMVASLVLVTGLVTAVYALRLLEPTAHPAKVRHALTVGFLATMVFAIGQRVLPAFSGMRLLFSTKLKFAAIFLLAVGCLLRVSSEILAYQRLVRSAWSWLPVSAITEMSAVTLFAANLVATFVGRPPSTQTQIYD